MHVDPLRVSDEVDDVRESEGRILQGALAPLAAAVAREIIDENEGNVDSRSGGLAGGLFDGLTVGALQPLRRVGDGVADRDRRRCKRRQAKREQHRCENSDELKRRNRDTGSSCEVANR